MNLVKQISQTIVLTAILFTTLLGRASAQQDYYFSDADRFDQQIPTPEEFLGYSIGSHFTRHDRIVSYFKELARLSNKVSFQVIGQTYELRPQVVLTITSPANQENLDEIRQSHLSVLDPSAPALDPETDKAVVALNYSVHGDETSSGEAALLTAYYLTANQDAETQKFLEEAVIHIDPAQNPDGRDRAANWHNSYKSFPPVADPADREHVQGWPRGRTNHFLHDLNRDWFAVTQQESANRLDFYHRWYPNVQIDFHEMGTNSTYYLEPTKPVRTWNPIIPEYHYEVLNPLLAEYQVEALNGVGSLYWTKEIFDNISPIYGSTYPDIQGGVGITFEVGSSRGIVQESTSGPVTFKSTIRKHLVTGIATVRAAVAEKKTLFEYQRDFYESALDEAAEQPVDAYVFGNERDETLTNKFLDLLLTHRIDVYELQQDMERDDRQFKQGSSYVVPTGQVGYRVVHDVFEPNTSFPDSVFYDITGWSLIQGYGINYAEIESGASDIQGPRVTERPKQEGRVNGGVSDYAYLLSWSDYSAPAALNALLQKEVLSKVAYRPFSIQTASGVKRFGYGSIVIPVARQPVTPDSLYAVVQKVAEQHKVDFHSVQTGFTEAGIDLGSTNIQPVEKPEVALVMGKGVRAYEAGEAWFLLNKRLELDVTKLDKQVFEEVSLDRYNTLALVDGRYDDWDSRTVDKIRDWVHSGGVLITDEGASEWAIRQEIVSEDLLKSSSDSTSETPRYNYEEQSDRRLANTIPGVILEADIDPTNPIAFGVVGREQLFIKDTDTFLKPSSNPYATVAKYTEAPLRGGFVNNENLQKISGTAAVVVKEEGRGKVILFADNPNFRSYWHTTSRLFLNAVLFGQNINL
ncbi:M14 family zinc carboxypeptidase [Fodinibius sediminis]|uniref:Zinc carboxypeptidase n=1 Tax=Fodinibius sediminis TaxID=1214077 RepID=A0A521C1H8_9BACT|nr:M14 family zinc carboxypeptidase [Fodinibius sediminis]SMO52570.1 Zinc carboxypeptidase [Fodinibius sediminis]